MCVLKLSLSFPPAPRWNVTCARGWQGGGGLYIGGTATLTNSNVYANRAGYVCSPFELTSSAPMERYDGTLRARRFGLQGGGIVIYGTATLTNTNVYANEATNVCSPSALA